VYFAIRDAGLQVWDGVEFNLEVALQHLWHVLADAQIADVLYMTRLTAR